jgi:hypothetical protein
VTPWTVLEGDAITRLAELPAASFHTVCTSPPYWQLRDYGTGTWEGGAAGCDHREPGTNRGKRAELPDPPAGWAERAQGAPYRDLCGKCGARRIDQQLGLERLPDCFAWARGVPRCGACYVCKMTDVFAAVRRVLRDDGTLWVNVASSFSSGAKQPKQHASNGVAVEGLDDEALALRDDLSPAEVAEVLSGLAAYQLDQSKVR